MLALTKLSFWKEDHSVHQILKRGGGRGGLTQPSFLERGWWEREDELFEGGGLQFLH